jgi:hypothetical protein
MQNKPKSAEVAVIDWLASYFLGCRFDIEAETDYLRAKYELKSLLEMPKSQRPLPRQQGQVIGARRPRYDVQRFLNLNSLERFSHL